MEDKSMMMVHTGDGRWIAKEELDLIEIPQETDTYKPVGHYDFVKSLLTISRDMLKDMELVKEQYAVARKGNQMFGMFSFKDTIHGNGIGCSVGFRNSYDKSMTIGIALGLKVFVCDNLAITGDIKIIRKHTLNVWQDIEDISVATLYKYRRQFDEGLVVADRWKMISLSDITAYNLMGNAFGNDLIGPRMLQVVKKEWKTPSFEDFKPRTAWSLYNAFTYALKAAPPASVLDDHRNIHQMFQEVIG